MNEFIAGALCMLGIAGILAGGMAAYYSTRHRDSAQERLLTRQYRVMTESANRDIPAELLANPTLISSRMEFRKIDAIEAELIHDTDSGVAKNLLKSFFHGTDPWVKARAAKALYARDPYTALRELKTLIQSESTFIQTPGIWALGEVATPPALDLLLPLLDNLKPELQEAAIRALIQIEIKERVPADSLTRVRRLLKELRLTSDWIL